MSISGSTVALLGRPGCGKGTQSRFLVQWLRERYSADVCYVYVGDECRALAKAATPEGERMRAILAAGEIPPTDLVEFVMVNPLLKAAKDQAVLYDGSPRLIGEARILDGVCRDLGRSLIIPVHIAVSDDECLRRVRSAERGRSDDREAVVKKRMAAFQAEVLKVLEYYSSDGRLITIEGNREPTEVFDELMEKLFKRLG